VVIARAVQHGPNGLQPDDRSIAATRIRFCLALDAVVIDVDGVEPAVF
jgi:hypothetical protein